MRTALTFIGIALICVILVLSHPSRSEVPATPKTLTLSSGEATTVLSVVVSTMAATGEQSLSIGDRVRVKRGPPFELPAELLPASDVVLVASEPGTTKVRDQQGREWCVSMCYVPAGMLYRLDGEEHWRPANDPCVVAELRRILAIERTHLTTADASQRVMLQTVCTGLKAQLAGQG